MVDTAILEAALGVNIDKSQYHELHGQWIWTLNRYFDIRLAGGAVLPGEGYKDIAQTVFTCGPTHTSQCEGEDVLLYGEARFRVNF